MKTLLIRPPVRSFMNAVAFNAGRRYPVGLLYLAAVLRRTGREAMVFDSWAFDEDSYLVTEPDDLLEVERRKLRRHPRWKHLVHGGAAWSRIATAIRSYDPDVVGISCKFSAFHHVAHRVAAISKSLLPKVPVVLGDTHATVAWERVLADPNVDAVVLGEAENLIVGVVDALAHRTPLDHLEGMAYRCGEGWCSCGDEVPRHVHHSPRVRWNTTLDDLPYPAIGAADAVDPRGTVTLITSRGCPFHCSFCTVAPISGRQFRARSPGCVVDEIEWHVRCAGVRRFSIEDDNFTFDMDRTQAICEEIVRRGLKIELLLPNGITVVKLTRERVRLLAAAGVRSLSIGLETADSETLRQIGKQFTSIDDVGQALAWCAELGIHGGAFMICGLPGQSVRDAARDAVLLACRRVPNATNAFSLVPGSRDYDDFRARGLLAADDDFAFHEMLDFAGNDRITPTESYWTYFCSIALGMIGERFVDGLRDRIVAARREALAGRALDTEAAIARLLGAPAVRQAGEVRIEAAECLCAVLGLPRAPAPGFRHTGLCTGWGDLFAMALSMCCGRAVGAREVECRHDTKAPRCVFAVVDGELPEAARAVAEIFVEELDRCLALQTRD